MPALLLPIIYLAFIALGLPDSALGSAWPSMYGELGAGVSWVGLPTAIISAGTILASITSTDVVRRLGTGRTTVISVALTAAGLLGFSCSTRFWQICLWAVPYGLGAGAVDAALNSYVSVHYASRHMSWLHCMWGIGASMGPAIISACLEWGTWSDGFLALGIIQLAITAVLALALPLWGRVREGVGAEGAAAEGAAAVDAEAAEEGAAAEHADDAVEAAVGTGVVAAAGSEAVVEDVGTSCTSIDAAPDAPPTRRELLRVPGVVEVLVCFFCYSALEGTCGAWAASYCTLARGVDAAQAAAWASLFYAGITVGRGANGFLTLRFSDAQLIRMGQAVIACGLVLIALPLGNWCAMAGLVIAGLGCAPIYPSIIHATPGRFGERGSLTLTGMEMAAAYTGSLTMSPLFGLVAEHVSPALYPFFLGALLVLMFVMAESCNRKVARNRSE